MQRILSLFLAAALLLGLLAGCGAEKTESLPPAPETTPVESAAVPSPVPSERPEPSAGPTEELSVQDIVESVYFSLVENAGGMGQMYYTTPEYYLTEFEVAKKDCADTGILSGSNKRLLAVLYCVDEDAANRVEEQLRSYADKQHTGQEEDPDAWDPAAVYRQGLYVGLFICPNQDQARNAFFSVLATDEWLNRIASVTEPPAFELQDLLFRLLIEGGACPNWRTVSSRDWFDSGSSRIEIDVASTYGITPRQYEHCVFAYWDPESSEYQGAASPYQLILFQTAGEEEAKALLSALEARRASLRAQLADHETDGERPAQNTRFLENLETAQVVQAGRYAALLICDDPAQLAICFTQFAVSADTAGFFTRYSQGEQNVGYDYDPNYPDRELFTPPNKDDMSIYDTTAILSAWKKGNPAGLPDYDRKIYDTAQTVLDEIVTDSMSDLEKETAVYAWLTNSVNYSWSRMDVLAETSRDAYGPYGGLVNHEAVCLGYAATFQLLMDMLDIECITVVGACVHSTGDHAWNMVRLNGNWYGVDPTWDANGREQVGEDYQWQYFNITSDELAENRQWDYANTPEAVTEGSGK